MDPGTALAIAGLSYDAIKDLYEYYRAWKDCGKDVAELRAQLLWLYSAFQSSEMLLKRPGLASHDRTLVESALNNCRAATEELKEVLEKIQTSIGRPQTAVQKLKTQGRKALYPFRKSTIQSLAENVETCQSSLELAVHLLGLNTATSSLEKLQAMDQKLVDGFVSLDDSFKKLRLNQQSHDARMISEIQASASKTQSAVETHRQETLLTNEALVQQQKNLEGILKTNEDREKAQIIINSLSTGELRRRRQDVRDAHVETFNWILADPDFSGSDDDQDSLSDQYSDDDAGLLDEKVSLHEEESFSDQNLPQGRSSLMASWLKSGNGLFWIRGKAGSGKSTLMKFLIEDERTEGFLQMWAGDSQVSIIQHFSWIAGTTLQKSHQGMLQDLLYQILNSDHNLVPTVCRKRWRSRSVVAQDWTTKELSNGLIAAIDQTVQHLCLIVDGLDEYFPDVEHDVLIAFLQRLASRQHVKILVSSRPWQVFESAFGHSQNKLHLEDLTYNDILLYTWNRLIYPCNSGTKMQLEILSTGQPKVTGASTDEDDKMFDLVRLIVRKADGVFLWVSLVLDALCERLKARQTLQDLQRHVRGLPADLEEYFRDMILNRIPKTWRAEMAIALKIKTTANDYELEFEPECLWVLAQFGISVFEHGSYEEIGTGQNCTERDKIAQTQNLVRNCCKDLLFTQVPEEGCNKEFLYGLRIEYTHRSVYDFIVQDDTQRTLAQYCPFAYEDKYFFSRSMLLRELVNQDRTLSKDIEYFINITIESLVPSFRTRTLEPEEYFDLMPDALITQHYDLLIERIDCASKQILEKEELVRLSKAGMLLLWLLRRRDFEKTFQRLLDKVVAKWPFVLKHLFRLGGFQSGTATVESLDVEKGEEFLGELRFYGRFL